MYICMDDVGREHFVELLQCQNAEDKWHRIAEIAQQQGFQGIQLSDKMYSGAFGLSLNEIPKEVHQFRLTFHIGELYRLTTDDDQVKVDQTLSRILAIASCQGMEDVSIHPPIIDDPSLDTRAASRKRLSELMKCWLPRYQEKGISLSLETHVTPAVFVFQGLLDYVDFVNGIPGLGVLIDFCHNCYDGNTIDQILSYVRDWNLRVTGLHLSDAISSADFHQGTHLPIGKGEIDFGKIVTYFNSEPNVYGALEIKGTVQEIADSVNMLRQWARC